MSQVAVVAEPRVGAKVVAISFDALIFYGLCALVVLLAIPYGAVEPWWVAFFECAVFMFGLMELIYRARNHTAQRIELSLLSPLLLLLLFALVQSLRFFPASTATAGVRTALSTDPFETRLFVIKVTALVIYAVLLVNHTTTRSRLRVLVNLIIGIALMSALFGMLRKDIQQQPGFFLPYLTKDHGFAQFINKNHFAFLIEMAFGLSIGLLAGQFRHHRRVLLLLPAVAVMWIALIVSNSRGGMMTSLCQILFLALMLDQARHSNESRKRQRSRRLSHRLASGAAVRLLLVVALVVCFAFGIGWVGGEPVANNFATLGNDFNTQRSQDRSNTSRRQIWRATWQLIKDNPIAGAGFGGYWTAITKYHDASGELTPQQAHNDYLELAASAGLIGVVLVLWFVILFIRKARAGLQTSDLYKRAASLGGLIGIFGVAVHSFVDFGLHITVNAAVLAVLVVIVTANIRVEVPAYQHSRH
jgi:putative inorganic carbon (HCO3(-)) transporter